MLIVLAQVFEVIPKRAGERLAFWQTESVRMSQERGQRMKW